MSTAERALQTEHDFGHPVGEGLRPWLVCLSAALFFFYEFIQMNMFSSINSELMRDFSLNGQ